MTTMTTTIDDYRCALSRQRGAEPKDATNGTRNWNVSGCTTVERRRLFSFDGTRKLNPNEARVELLLLLLLFLHGSGRQSLAGGRQGGAPCYDSREPRAAASRSAGSRGSPSAAGVGRRRPASPVFKRTTRRLTNRSRLSEISRELRVCYRQGDNSLKTASYTMRQIEGRQGLVRCQRIKR
ncbi:hypothetical protein P5V15_009764 [Pogonomyrmex californicus]